MGGKRMGAVKLRWTEDAPEGIHAGAWAQSLQDVGAACVQALQALDTVSEIAPDFMRLHDRVAEVAKCCALGRCERFANALDGSPFGHCRNGARAFDEVIICDGGR
jgi:ATP-dependent DNA helicase DinG